MKKKQPKEISAHFKALAEKSWGVRRKKILEEAKKKSKKNIIQES